MTLNYMEILIKLALGLFSLVFVINVTGKGNLAPNSATDQIQNYVLGGIIGGVIYNSSISILQYAVILMMWTILVLTLKWLNNNVRFVKRLIDGKPTLLIKNGQIDPEACRSVGLSAAEVALKLRSQGIFQMKQVKCAVQEQNGQLIVVQMGDMELTHMKRYGYHIKATLADGTVEERDIISPLLTDRKSVV